MKHRILIGIALCMVWLAGLMPGVIPAMAATPSTSVTVTKYASDNATILAQVTKEYTWLEANKTVYGDGTTHYYHQGPTFDAGNLWEPSENVNLEDEGAAKGTDINDLLNLVGGAPAGSEIEFKSTDNFSRRFAANDVNALDPGRFRMVLTWYNATFGGYVPAYSTGMRLIFFDAITNAAGQHAYGNQDMYDTLSEPYRYFYSGTWPSSKGLSAKYVDRINIFTNEAPPPVMDVLYNGTVTLTPGSTFSVTAYNSSVAYTVNGTTPLGALNAAATAGSFTYAVTDKNYAGYGTLLLDNVGSYERKKPGYWYAYVNDVYKDGYNNPAGGLNLIQLVNGDKVEFYYAAGIADPTNLTAVKAAATAAVKTVASTGVAPTDWTLQLSGARDDSITRAYFESALACASSGHQVFWKDSDNNTWGGVPLWFLVGVVDDDPDVGPYHFNFNDSLAAQHYQINVISSDGWKATLDSADIARSDGYIIANTLNGDPLPLKTPGDKPCWPLFLKGAAVFGGQQVGGVVRIELTNLPQPPAGWSLAVVGDVGDNITQAEFEQALACPGSPHYREWTDKDGNVWSGVPLWILVGTVDDIETGDHWTFNDAVAAAGYTVNVTADGFSRSFASANVANSDNFIVANQKNGAPLPESDFPLRLVGPGVTKADGSLGALDPETREEVQQELLRLYADLVAILRSNIGIAR